MHAGARNIGMIQSCRESGCVLDVGRRRQGGDVKVMRKNLGPRRNTGWQCLLAAEADWQNNEVPMRVCDAMTPEVQLCTPQDTLKEAAEAMAALGIGLLPVAD